MKSRIYRLTENDLKMKKLYESGGQALLERPMSFDEYLRHQETHRVLVTAMRQCSRENTENRQGSTVCQVEDITQGGEIELVLHGRYSYPVMHNHSYVEIIYVYDGSCRHFVEEQEVRMYRGDICILAPHTMHAVSAAMDDAIIINILISRKLFNTSFMNMLRGGRILTEFFEQVFYQKKSSPYIIFPTGEDPRIQEVILHMYEERYAEQYAYSESLELYIRLVFIHLIRQYEIHAVVPDPVDSERENHITAILGYMCAHYSRVTLGDAAGFFGYSESYLSRLLKRCTGRTFRELINEMQMEQAEKLIREGQLSLSQISQEVGCFDASHLSKKFKKRYGESPDQYRKHREGGPL